MNQDQIESALRTVLKVGGGIVASKGWADSAHVELIIGGLVALAGALWSHFHHSTDQPKQA